MITFLIAYGGFAAALCIAAIGYACWCAHHQGDPLERIFGDDLAKIRQLPEARERVR